MTITTSTGQTQTFTETEMAALAVRFAILSKHGERRFFVDGVEVSEADYLRAFEAASCDRVR